MLDRIVETDRVLEVGQSASLLKSRKVNAGSANVEVEFWDCSGSQTFSHSSSHTFLTRLSMRDVYVSALARSMHGLILVFQADSDVSPEQSLDAWYNLIHLSDA